MSIFEEESKLKQIPNASPIELKFKKVEKGKSGTVFQNLPYKGMKL